MVDETDTPDDEAVGYRRPPKASRFPKGESGNPFGRPKKTSGSRAIAARVLGEIQRLTGQPKGARVRFTTLEVIVMALKHMTAAGHSRATALYLRYVGRYGSQETAERRYGFIVLPEKLTEEEWEAKYSPKDEPPGGRYLDD